MIAAYDRGRQQPTDGEDPEQREPTAARVRESHIRPRVRRRAVAERCCGNGVEQLARESARGRPPRGEVVGGAVRQGQQGPPVETGPRCSEAVHGEPPIRYRLEI